MLKAKEVDLILYNGIIITVNKNFSIEEAVAIKDDRFIFVGDNEQALLLAGPSTVKINLEGAAVIPGIIDAHNHLDRAATSELYEEIPDVHTIPELLDWIRSEVEKKKPGEWIIHEKFFYTRLNEMRQPYLEELDNVAPENPVFLNGSFGGMINSAAFRISGIPLNTKNSGFLRDEETGKLNGAIRLSVFDLLKGIKQPSVSEEQKLEALKVMFNRYNQVGITSVCIGTGEPRLLDDYRKIRENGNLTLRINQNMTIPGYGKKPLNELKEIINGWQVKTGSGDEWIRVGALKTFIDGGILTGTAYMSEPWGQKAAEVYGFRDVGYRGVLNLTKTDLVLLINMAIDLGWKISAHITGDGGVNLYLDAIEEVSRDKKVKDKRIAIIHGNFFSPEAIERAKKLGVYADMQPAWFYKDADAMRAILGKERSDIFHPYKSLIDAGIVVNGGSDHMVKLDPDTSVNPYNPFPAMWSVISRKTERGSTIVPEEAITREDSLRMYTINNAYATFEEKIKGSIEIGKLADLAVLSDNILTCSIDRIRDISVLMCIVGGEVVHEKGLL